MVFLMANGCATRVQRICKKLQTVLEEGVFCWAVKGYFQRLAGSCKGGVVWPLRISRAASCKREVVVLFRGRELFLGRVFTESEGDSHLSAVRSVFSFPKFGWRGERFTFRDDFLA